MEMAVFAIFFTVFSTDISCGYQIEVDCNIAIALVSAPLTQFCKGNIRQATVEDCLFTINHNITVNNIGRKWQTVGTIQLRDHWIQNSKWKCLRYWILVEKTWYLLSFLFCENHSDNIAFFGRTRLCSGIWFYEEIVLKSCYRTWQ